MTSTPCAIDRRSVADGARLCRHCTAELRRDLEAVPDLVADLLVTLSRQDHIAPGRPGRSAETPLVYNDGAARELASLHFYLSSWARCIADDTGLSLGGVTAAAAAYADWLLEHLNAVRRHDAAADLACEIYNVVRDARRATDLAAVSSRFLVGPCPLVADGAFCDGDVLATITTSADEPPTMTCLRCEYVWEAHQWLRAGKRIKNRRDEIDWKPRPRRPREDAP